MSVLRTPWHLAKRVKESVMATPLTDGERTGVTSVLLSTEYELFEKLTVADQRHALNVLRRFDTFAPGAPIGVRRAALLHDIGKVEARLGTFARIAATVVGPRTKAFRRYHQHEHRGRELLTAAGSDGLTLHILTLMSGLDHAPGSRITGSQSNAGSSDAADAKLTSWCDALLRADAI
jgi:hypothetical protein